MPAPPIEGVGDIRPGGHQQTRMCEREFVCAGARLLTRMRVCKEGIVRQRTRVGMCKATHCALKPKPSKSMAYTGRSWARLGTLSRQCSKDAPKPATWCARVRACLHSHRRTARILRREPMGGATHRARAAAARFCPRGSRRRTAPSCPATPSTLPPSNPRAPAQRLQQKPARACAEPRVSPAPRSCVNAPHWAEWLAVRTPMRMPALRAAPAPRESSRSYYAAQQIPLDPSFLHGFFFCHLVVGRSRAQHEIQCKYTLSCTRARQSHKIENWYQPGRSVVNKGGPKSALVLR